MATMPIRFVVALWASMALASACDCVKLSAKAAEREAEIVFRGTVVAMHESSDHFPIATFKVVRVWKGDVTETFEMLAMQERSGCLGFGPPVEIGADFLVYARRPSPSVSDYLPLPCQSDLASRARDQIQKLGLGRKPQKTK
jgi:hypothetical protein